MASILNLNSNEIQQICRICLSKEIIVNILSAQYEDVSIKSVFQCIFQEQIDEDDKCPASLCADCLTSLLHFYDFMKKYEKTKLILKQLNDVLLSPKDKADIDKQLDVWEIKQEITDVDFKSRICPSEDEETHDKELYVCRLCDYDGRIQCPKKPKMGLLRHYFHKHFLQIEKSALKCVKCCEEFASLDETLQHTFSDQHQSKECPNCKKTFKSMMQQYQHVKKKSCEKEVFFCHLCQVHLENFEKAMDHYREKNHRVDSKCMLCNKLCKNMHRHFMTHRPQRLLYTCVPCQIPFDNKKDFARHKLDTDHSKRQCYLCGMVVHRKLFSRHLIKHKKDMKFVCHICGKSFTLRDNLQRHYKRTHEGKRFYCDQCTVSYTTLGLLKEHVAKVHDKKVIVKSKLLTRICEICGKRLSKYNKKQVALHEAFHKTGHQLICKVSDCLVTFHDEEARKCHMNSEHKSFKCDQCNRSYFNDREFKTHCSMHIWRNNTVFKSEEVKNNDGNITLIVCRICNQQFQSYSLLAEHLKEKYGLYICIKGDNCCYKVFPSSVGYYQHILIHIPKDDRKLASDREKEQSSISSSAQQRPLSCSVCLSRFRTPQQLKVHLRTHTGEKLYQCRYCSKKFAHLHNKKRHERIHTGEKPYCCRYCAKPFSDPGAIKRHEAAHRRNKTTDLDDIEKDDEIEF